MDNNIEIKKYERISDAPSLELDLILKNCTDYELYTDDGFPIYIGYINGAPAGILTYIISTYEITPEADINDSDFSKLPSLNVSPEYEIEIRCFVSPKYRGIKLCTKLISRIKEDIDFEYKIVYTLPPALLSSSLASFPAYGELLFCLEKNNFKENDLKNLELTVRKRLAPLLDCSADSIEIKALASDDNNRFELFINGKTLASLSTSYSESMCFIHNVFISPRLRGMGLGSFLLESSMAHHFKNHSTPVLVNTRSSNIPACNLYIKTGFEEIERIWFYSLI